jgi:hypothetical protein
VSRDTHENKRLGHSELLEVVKSEDRDLYDHTPQILYGIRGSMPSDFGDDIISGRPVLQIQKYPQKYPQTGSVLECLDGRARTKP